ncbi:hypothetical protein ACI0FM_14620 [Paenochrobactrum sp. BZR 588]|uniref:hypothetical protein n=1 Tax=Paenochrobactrum sp. BZR 588 TaxID=3378076 RepID=UPI003854E6F2
MTNAVPIRPNTPVKKHVNDFPCPTFLLLSIDATVTEIPFQHEITLNFDFLKKTLMTTLSFNDNANDNVVIWEDRYVDDGQKEVSS